MQSGASFLERHSRAGRWGAFLIFAIGAVSSTWTVGKEVVPWAVGLVADGVHVVTGGQLPDLSGVWAPLSWAMTVVGAVLLFLIWRSDKKKGASHGGIRIAAVGHVETPEEAIARLHARVKELETGAGATGPPAEAPRDPKWAQGDQLMFEGLALLDEIRKGGDRKEQASAWLEDVREFLRTHNPTAWAMFDAPTGLLPFRSSGYPHATVELATSVDRALFLIRLTNPRRYARIGVARGRGDAG